jgi:hypothetical protein
LGLRVNGEHLNDHEGVLPFVALKDLLNRFSSPLHAFFTPDAKI